MSIKLQQQEALTLFGAASMVEQAPRFGARGEWPWDDAEDRGARAFEDDLGCSACSTRPPAFPNPVYGQGPNDEDGGEDEGDGMFGAQVDAAIANASAWKDVEARYKRASADIARRYKAAKAGRSHEDAALLRAKGRELAQQSAVAAKAAGRAGKHAWKLAVEAAKQAGKFVHRAATVGDDGSAMRARRSTPLWAGGGWRVYRDPNNLVWIHAAPGAVDRRGRRISVPGRVNVVDAPDAVRAALVQARGPLIRPQARLGATPVLDWKKTAQRLLDASTANHKVEGQAGFQRRAYLRAIVAGDGPQATHLVRTLSGAAQARADLINEAGKGFGVSFGAASPVPRGGAYLDHVEAKARAQGLAVTREGNVLRVAGRNGVVARLHAYNTSFPTEPALEVDVSVAKPRPDNPAFSTQKASWRSRVKTARGLPGSATRTFNDMSSWFGGR